MEKDGRVSKFTTKDLAEIGMMAAIIFVGTYLNIPYYIGSSKSMIHLGTAVLFIAVLLVGKRRGAIAAAIGLSLFDLFSVTPIWAPFTFIIKGGMAYIVGMIAYRGQYNGESMLNNILAFLLGGVFNIIGYYFVDALFYGSFIVAFQHVPSSLITTIIGVIVAVPVGKILKKSIGSRI
ncbi:ECF transporter S component [Clostridium neuense]|uniref:ECF transporter S component n=1 Tax=Clostridium neuense TaxID=1728934 RepID=A0ABW8TLL4_9CLOT